MLRPSRLCAYSGCATLTQDRYCDAHASTARRRNRAGSLTQVRQSGHAPWKDYSAHFLRAHPFCADPFSLHVGRLVPATVTGHKVAHKGNKQLFWDKNNHYPLCWSCNSYQCAKHEGGFGNARQELPLTR